MQFKEDFDKVVQFVDDLNHNVEVTKNTDNDYFYPDSKTIIIQDRDGDFKTMLLYLLHETGHMINHLKWKKSNKAWSKKYLRYSLDNNVNEDKEYFEDWFQVSNMLEENLAWSSGKELISKLKLSLSHEDFDIEWTDAIKAYILHSANVLNNKQKS